MTFALMGGDYMPIDKETKLGDILKRLREEKTLTQEDISEILKVKRQTYSAWERNVSSPDINTVDFLADYYGVSVDYLLGKTMIKSPIETVAAHHDGEDWTEEELESIEEFKEFVRMRREQKKTP